MEECIIEHCKNKNSHKPTGFCTKHYACWYRTQDPIPKKKPRRNKICSVEGCLQKHRRNGFCSKHSARYYRHRDVNKLNYRAYESNEERKTALKHSQKRYNTSSKGKAASKRKIHKRRHLEKSDVKISTDDYNFIYKKFENKCFNCGSIHKLTFDHHIPLSKGGKLNRENTVLLCHLCNSTKSNKDPEEFYSKEKLELLK